MLQQHTDDQINELNKENEILKSRIANYEHWMKNNSNQESAIMVKVDEAITEYKKIIDDKTKENDHLNDIIAHLRENLARQNIDSDKASVSALQKVSESHLN